MPPFYLQEQQGEEQAVKPWVGLRCRSMKLYLGAEKHFLTWRTPGMGARGGGRQEGCSHSYQDPAQP